MPSDGLFFGSRIPDPPKVDVSSSPIEFGEAFQAGTYAMSLRAVALEGKTVREVHDSLLQQGYRCRRFALVAHRTRSGAAQWRTRHGLTHKLDDAASEYVYTHSDGGIVRVFPDRGPTIGFDEAVKERVPFARRSVARNPSGGVDWANEGAVVTAKNIAIPPGLRSSDGIRFDPQDLVRSYRLARTVLAEQAIALRSSEWGVPAMPFTEGRALSGGLTLVPLQDFPQVAKLIYREVMQDRAIELRENGNDLQLFFAGNREVGKWLTAGCHGLASLTIHRGAFVLGVDVLGYDASVEALVTYVMSLLRRLGGVRAFDNVTGKDLTSVLQRTPTALLGALDPTSVRFEDRPGES